MGVPIGFAGTIGIVADGACLLKGRATCLEGIECMGGWIVILRIV